MFIDTDTDIDLDFFVKYRSQMKCNLIRLIFFYLVFTRCIIKRKYSQQHIKNYQKRKTIEEID